MRQRRTDRHLGVASLLVADEHEGDAVNGGKAADHGRVIKTGAVAVQLHKLVTDIQRNVQEGGPVGVPCHLQPLHGRQPRVCVLAKLQQTRALVSATSTTAVHILLCQVNRMSPLVLGSL